MPAHAQRKDVVFEPTPHETVARMLNLARVGSGFAVGILATVANRSIRGIAVGGLATVANRDIRGLSVSGLATVANGDVRGITVGGLGAVANGDARGILVGGLGSVVNKDARGIVASALGTVVNGQAKGILFEMLGHGRDKGVRKSAVLNADDAHWRYLADRAGEKVRVLTYGIDALADVQAVLQADANGSRIRISVGTEQVELALPLVGRFNVHNALAAAGAGVAAGVPLATVKTALERAQHERVRGLAERRVELDLARVLEAVDLVQPAAADDPDLRLRRAHAGTSAST